MQEVSLIEDNALAHIKGAKICANTIKEKSIKEEPANSAGLYPIEDIWDRKKDLLSSKWEELRGTGIIVQDQTRKEVAKV